MHPSVVLIIVTKASGSPVSARRMAVGRRRLTALHVPSAILFTLSDGMSPSGQFIGKVVPFTRKVVTHPIFEGRGIRALYITRTMLLTLGNGILMGRQFIGEMLPFVGEIVTHPVFKWWKFPALDIAWAAGLTLCQSILMCRQLVRKLLPLIREVVAHPVFEWWKGTGELALFGLGFLMMVSTGGGAQEGGLRRGDKSTDKGCGVDELHAWVWII